MAVFESPETVDMMICLKEILEVTLVPPESVVKVSTYTHKKARTVLYKLLMTSETELYKFVFVFFCIRQYVIICLGVRIPSINSTPSFSCPFISKTDFLSLK